MKRVTFDMPVTPPVTPNTTLNSQKQQADRRKTLRVTSVTTFFHSGRNAKRNAKTPKKNGSNASLGRERYGRYDPLRGSNAVTRPNLGLMRNAKSLIFLPAPPTHDNIRVSSILFAL